MVNSLKLFQIQSLYIKQYFNKIHIHYNCFKNVQAHTHWSFNPCLPLGHLSNWHNNLKGKSNLINAFQVLQKSQVNECFGKYSYQEENTQGNILPFSSWKGFFDLFIYWVSGNLVLILLENKTPWGNCWRSLIWFVRWALDILRAMVQRRNYPDPVTHRTILDVDKVRAPLSPRAAYRSAGRDHSCPHRKGAFSTGGVKNSFKYMTV